MRVLGKSRCTRLAWHLRWHQYFCWNLKVTSSNKIGTLAPFKKCGILSILRHGGRSFIMLQHLSQRALYIFPCSVLHSPLSITPSTAPQYRVEPARGTQLPGLRSRNIFCISISITEAQSHRGHIGSALARSGTCWHASPLPLRKTKPFYQHQGSWSQRTRRCRSYSISIPLLEANRPL